MTNRRIFIERSFVDAAHEQTFGSFDSEYGVDLVHPVLSASKVIVNH